MEEKRILQIENAPRADVAAPREKKKKSKRIRRISSNPWHLAGNEELKKEKMGITSTDGRDGKKQC